MIKSILRLVYLILLVGGWSLAALSLHVIRTPDEFPITLVTKEHFSLRDTYVDTRTWTLDDAAQHPDMVNKLIALGKADVLKHLADAKSGDVKGQLISALQHGPKKDAGATQPAASNVLGGLFGMFR
ncbi:MAG TPA: hypothetical protein VHD56_09140 [Tepidisphaeraceae bacterium]|nr:hypothetical protein [Tepidisphaeraceae bacterium]